jgi:hypothetical protein
MKNSFMFVEYENFSFKAPLTISVQGINITVQCKIDTGCMKTCIPIKRLNVSDATALKLKGDAIRSGGSYNRTYGVSDTQANKDADALLIKQGRLVECTSLRFIQHAEKFEIAGYDFGQMDVGVNYDRYRSSSFVGGFFMPFLFEIMPISELIMRENYHMDMTGKQIAG